MDICRDDSCIEVEKQIVWQCAPVIMGIKTANLLVLSNNLSYYAGRIFKNTNLSLYPLCTYESKRYYLLYQPYKLNQYLHEEANCYYLSQLGYSLTENETIIKKIAYKYSKYMSEKREFPHEIGLLLGYPLVDVINFVSHNGTEYLYSGYWKVYDNLFETLSVFSRYHKAREILYRFIMHGGTLKDVIQNIIQYE